ACSAVSLIGATPYRCRPAGRDAAGPGKHPCDNRAPRADLRIPLQQRSYLRGHPADGRSTGHYLRGLRSAGRAGVPPGGGPLQGEGLLHDRLRVEVEVEGRERRGWRREVLRFGLEGLRVQGLRLEGQGHGEEPL